MKELGQTDFQGKPEVLSRDQRHVLSAHLTKFLDDVAEVYSPPRCTKEAKKQKMKATLALDLSTGWDFRRADHRKEALRLIAQRRPAVLILSPPCTVFSALRHLSSFKREAREVQQEIEEGLMHMRFAISLCRLQLKEGRGFILEQPRNATSWQLQEMMALLEEPEVYKIYLDRCRFELRAARGPFPGQHAKKPTALISNIPELAKHVEKRCLKNHEHGMLLGGAAKPAAIYTPSFVRALLNGIKEALEIKSSAVKTKELQPWFQQGRALGVSVYHFAREQCELEQEVSEAYHISFPAMSEEPLVRPMDDDEEDVPMEDVRRESQSELQAPQDDDDPVVSVRRELRQFSENPELAKALDKVEDFEKTDEGTFSISPHLRREVHRVHRNIGHPGLDIFLRALKNAGVKDEVLQWTSIFAAPFVSPGLVLLQPVQGIFSELWNSTR